MNREYTFLCGEQTSGKTYQLRSAIAYYKSKESIHAIFICDRLGEYTDQGTTFYSWEAYLDYTYQHSLPRVCVFRLGESGACYGPVFAEAIEQGNCLVVLDEAYEFAKAGSSWQGDPSLRRIILSGRHLEDINGKMCRTHLLVAAQYPKTCHLTVWQQARTVMCGRISGESARKWVKDGYGNPKLDKVDKLEKWQWCVLQGEKPKWLRQPRI
jgi:hypothetical protein